MIGAESLRIGDQISPPKVAYSTAVGWSGLDGDALGFYLTSIMPRFRGRHAGDPSDRVKNNRNIPFPSDEPQPVLVQGCWLLGSP